MTSTMDGVEQFSVTSTNINTVINLDDDDDSVNIDDLASFISAPVAASNKSVASTENRFKEVHDEGNKRPASKLSSEQTAVICDPDPQDIHVYRGNAFFQNEGNVNYRNLIHDCKDNLHDTNLSTLASNIISQLRPGRFLTKIGEGKYKILDHDESMKKVVSSLRTARKYCNQDRQEDGSEENDDDAKSESESESESEPLFAPPARMKRRVAPSDENAKNWPESLIADGGQFNHHANDNHNGEGIGHGNSNLEEGMMVNETNINPADVIIVKGKHHRNEGNLKYRKLLHDYKDKYSDDKDPAARRSIALEIISQLRPGRFLTMNSARGGGGYKILDQETAVKKVLQSLARQKYKSKYSKNDCGDLDNEEEHSENNDDNEGNEDDTEHEESMGIIRKGTQKSKKEKLKPRRYPKRNASKPEPPKAAKSNKTKESSQARAKPPPSKKQKSSGSHMPHSTNGIGATGSTSIPSSNNSRPHQHTSVHEEAARIPSPKQRVEILEMNVFGEVRDGSLYNRINILEIDVLGRIQTDIESFIDRIEKLERHLGIYYK